MNNNIKDVFFDLDHTLWDFDRNSGLTFKKIFEINNLEVDIERFLFHYEPINLEYWKLYREEQIDKPSLRFGRLNDAFLELGKALEKDFILKLSNDYIEHLATYNYLFDNTISILNYLNKRYNLHIITNGFEEIQHKKMYKSNIVHFFKTVTNSEMVGVKKPNPKIFKFALSLAQANVNTSIMIGDSYEADILGAKNVGMDTILFDPKNHFSENNQKKIQNLNQLRDIL
ncbi:YjjG family noncanonical pyrimidine nucleotidase [Seonamhaeicola sp. ML3]|uniref:YjjG family noncanonical pyrimidine nucleotidase n=1 Tax=Seonamhaeicola sp. ML3 TaxID=2937786 RepID=UPI00200C037C|nr:YjjG family noncanonical pyrimidine nucleotidase [Seonamhaeicola sp. ML3]